MAGVLRRVLNVSKTICERKTNTSTGLKGNWGKRQERREEHLRKKGGGDGGKPEKPQIPRFWTICFGNLAKKHYEFSGRLRRPEGAIQGGTRGIPLIMV